MQKVIHTMYILIQNFLFPHHWQQNWEDVLKLCWMSLIIGSLLLFLNYNSHSFLTNVRTFLKKKKILCILYILKYRHRKYIFWGLQFPPFYHFKPSSNKQKWKRLKQCKHIVPKSFWWSYFQPKHKIWSLYVIVPFFFLIHDNELLLWLLLTISFFLFSSSRRISSSQITFHPSGIFKMLVWM